jgi:hypothetical protein
MGDDDLSGDPIAEAFERAQRLPPAAVEALFRRYGRPLAVPIDPLGDGEPRVDLMLADGALASVRVVELRMPVDVIANHWFVLDDGGEEPLAVPGPLFAAALAALARALERAPPG